MSEMYKMYQMFPVLWLLGVATIECFGDHGDHTIGATTTDPPGDPDQNPAGLEPTFGSRSPPILSV